MSAGGILSPPREVRPRVVTKACILDRNTTQARRVEPPGLGRVVAIPQGGCTTDTRGRREPLEPLAGG
jgi:hypothetical protein